MENLCNSCSRNFLPVVMRLKDRKKHSIRYEEDCSDGHTAYYGVVYHSKDTLPVPAPESYTIYMPLLVEM